MSSGVFSAFVLPAFGTAVADHTYVEIDGQAFGCWGRSAGGTFLVTGTGDAALGICLATPSGRAGVIYGRSGVCHQAANRILWPARVNVATAAGARASMLLWGTFGRDGNRKQYSPTANPWLELTLCQAQLSSSASGFSNQGDVHAKP
jgi:hypothetical protein